MKALEPERLKQGLIHIKQLQVSFQEKFHNAQNVYHKCQVGTSLYYLISAWSTLVLGPSIEFGYLVNIMNFFRCVCYGTYVDGVLSCYYVCYN